MTTQTRPAKTLLAFFDDDVVGFESSEPGDSADLSSEEAALVATAVAKRRDEFAAGRACAHRALAELAAPALPLLRDSDRCPVWPASTIGSITHARGYAAAVAAPADAYWGIGIDAERRGRVPDDLEQRICGATERAWLADLPGETRRDMLTAIFSAKEAIYKCLFPVVRETLGFLDATLHIDREVFEATLHRPLRGLPGFETGEGTLSGGLRITESHVFAGTALARDRDLAAT